MQENSRSRFHYKRYNAVAVITHILSHQHRPIPRSYTQQAVENLFRDGNASNGEILINNCKAVLDKF